VCTNLSNNLIIIIIIIIIIKEDIAKSATTQEGNFVGDKFEDFFLKKRRN
jgi:hypothetical protein